MRNVLRVALLAAFVVMNAGAADEPASTSPAGVGTLVHNYLTDAARLREQGLTPEERASLAQRVADERAALKNARKDMRIKAGAKPFGTTAANDTTSPAKRCETCRFVFKQVNMKLGKLKYPQSVFAEFEATCMDVKTNLDQNACADMYDDIYAMTDDFLNNEETVCANAKMCPP